MLIIADSMRISTSALVGLMAIVIVCFCVSTTEGHDGDGHYTNDWVVRIAGVSAEGVDQLAAELGYHNMGQLKGFENTYVMRKLNHPERSRRNSGHLTKRLSQDIRVEWAEQQVTKTRVKRDSGSASTVNFLRETTKQNQRFNDFLWPDQWYLHDTRNLEDIPELDMRTIPVWNMGYTGKGVVVTIMDDGLEWNHTDLYRNYDPKASWDSNDDDPDPFPRYDESDSNNHGTRCAGEVAMSANNQKCGVGVAYGASIGGIRMLDGPVNDVVESVSLAHAVDHVDVFSASWGPNDDGMTVDGPKRLALEALQKGIREGRGGKGVIYVWASGNGGSKGDNCNCDGYTNSLYTLSVGSASQRGDFPWYGERCASTLTTAYSSGAYSDQKIATTDLHNKCTVHHTGTSAAAPLAAGVVALVLEANPDLTWRDVQHLVVWTSEYLHLRNNKGWRRNGAGLMYNSRFGFGLINAELMVKMALNWTLVPEKTSCNVNATTRLPLPISSKAAKEVHVIFQSSDDNGCGIRHLEHVEVTLDVEYNHRGALDIFLFSPSGTVSMILSRRERDSSAVGFRNWTFLSVHFWGENPSGRWRLLIRDLTGKNYEGAVKSARLTLHGTMETPAHMRNGHRRYFGNPGIMERTIDRMPEFEEELPKESDDSSKFSAESIDLESLRFVKDWPSDWIEGQRKPEAVYLDAEVDYVPSYYTYEQ
nr:venom protein [Lampona murina]